jgi:acetyltransferase-like isoleucine patch superfamily enzyme
MERTELLEHFNKGDPVGTDPEYVQLMRFYSREAQKITMEINTRFHEPEELAALFSRLIGKPVGEGFSLFPPFCSDFGKNITVGKNVFINADCKFQDQGGIFIDDGALIGHGVVLATLNPALFLYFPKKPATIHHEILCPFSYFKNSKRGERYADLT